MLNAFLGAIDPFGLTPEEIAEAVWLARYVPEVPAAPLWPGSRTLPDAPTDPSMPRPTASTRPKDGTSGLVDPERQPPEPRAAVRLPRGDQALAQGDSVPLRIPAITAIPHGAALLRALRPLRQAVQWRGPVGINEAKTADEIAQTGVWSPHLTPQATRRFELALVVDSSAAVGVWQRTVDELRVLVERLGAFRDVHMWSLDQGAGGLVLRAKGSGGAGLARDTAALIDPSGRRAVLLLSDCVGEPWRSGAISMALRQWARTGPVAVIQALPYRLWGRCAANVIPVSLSRNGPRYANADLVVCPRPGQPAQLLADLGVVVPVLDLEPRWLASWANLLAGARHEQVDAMVIGTSRVVRTDVLTVHPDDVDPDDLLMHFHAGASAPAFQLARYLAVVPLTLPVMHLVQTVMLPGSRPSHLAEVILGGLLRRAERPDPVIDIEYDFRPGVRESLLASLRRTDTLRVLQKVSDFVKARLGARHDFHALLTADAESFAPFGLSPAFATVAATVLRSLGGRYAVLADRLRPSAAAMAPAVGPSPRHDLPEGDTVSSFTPRRSDAPPDQPPDRPPTVFEGVPPRNAHFTGREHALRDLRDRLAGGMAAVIPCALYGLGGVGKTQLAVEYCYRYQNSYELVWWAPAEQGSTLRGSLVELAPHLNVPAQEDRSQTVNAVLDALRRGEPFKRWLLVLDNASGPDDVQELFRYSTGHVLLTSRDRTWAGSESASALEIDVFNRSESVSLLRHRIPDVSPADAARLAERVGDLPMALEQAAAYQLVYGVSIEDYLKLLDQNPEGVLGKGRAPGYDQSVQSTFRIAFEGLRQRSRAAAQMMELVAFFGPEPISRRLLLSGRNVALPSPLSSVVHDDLQVIQAVGEIGRLSLARLDPRRGTLQVHRLLTELVRGGMTEADQRRNLRFAQEILAQANPGEPDNARTWEQYAEILPHVVAVGCVDGETPGVRKVVLDLVRYLYAVGDYPGSWDLGEPAMMNWRNRLGIDAEETLILARHVGNSLRDVGRHAEARTLNEDTWERLRAVFGLENVHTLVMTNSFGADLRVSGEYQRAHDLDWDNLGRLRDVFGHEDINTLRSLNNYAVDLRLLGRYREAKAADESNVVLCRDVLGWDHPLTHQVNSNLARDLYGVGDYRGALALLEQMLPAFEARVGREHSNLLRAMRTYAVTLRKMGRAEDARVLLNRMLRTYRVKFGEDHIDTVAAVATLSKVLLTLGEPHAALGRGEAALEAFRAVLGPAHPFALSGGVNVSVILRATGNTAAAARLDQACLAGYTDTVGEHHPFTLCAMASVATNTHIGGDTEGATRISEQVWLGSKRVRGETHPNTFNAALNYGLDLRATGETDRADEFITLATDGLTAIFGADHHDVTGALAGRRAEFDIEPPPI